MIVTVNRSDSLGSVGLQTGRGQALSRKQPHTLPVAELTEGGFICSIVTIHGLGGHRISTWRKSDDIWLRDFLAEHERIRGAGPRVSTFGYDAAVAFTGSVSDLRDYALQLLNQLYGMRQEVSAYNALRAVLLANCTLVADD